MRDPEGAGPGDSGPPLSSKLTSAELIACILGTPDAPLAPAVVLDGKGSVVSVRFSRGDVVTFQPGPGVPRRIEAKGPDGRAVLTLESYGPWPEGEGIPPL